tara:strand:+ start:8556 stop:9629 length:1074 start_codon:yes stop_codon:yes gene_type:complete
MEQFVTNEEIIQRARQNLADGPWNYLVGATESETTMRRNRLAFDRIAFQPRVLIDVSSIDSSAQILGHEISIPIIMAPIGSLQVFHPDAAIAVSKAAENMNTIHVVSSVTEPALEETAKSSNNTKFYQLYIHGDWDWTKNMIDRVVDSGYEALCITVDSASYSLRERPMVSRWVPMSRRNPPEPHWQASVTWETLAKIKNYCKLPLMVKGLATPDDAKLCVEHGVDVIWVSNHGGRQLDHGLGTLDMLPAIANTTKGNCQIILDGGIQRGSDVAKAIALGADAVAIGKMQGWGLAAAGSDGVTRVLNILKQELEITMKLLGVTKLSQLDTKYVCEAVPTTDPHEMSSWVNMPKNRIQ